MRIYYDIEYDKERFGLDNFRGLKKAFTGAMKRGVVFWHRSFIGKHFDRRAYGAYRSTYLGDGVRPKKSPGRPLFITGNLKSNVEQQFSEGAVRGTFKSSGPDVGVKLKYGRPSKYTGENLKAEILATRERMGIDWRAAEAKVLSRAGYGQKLRKIFQERITAVNPSEERQIIKTVRDDVGNHMAKRGKSRKRIKV